MASVNWNKLEVGDFFTANINMGQDTLLYQKIQAPGVLHNAVLLNTGEICNLYIAPDSKFEKVEVTFSFKPTE